MLTAIIFTYNHKDSISRCIESILNQNTSYNYEIHIWDDCSIDGTSDICRKYAAKYKEKIKLTVQKKNTFCGPYLEMQSLSAINAIKTKYFCIIDGDDYWCDVNKIQIALDFLEMHPEYNGFAHDTLQKNSENSSGESYIHNLLNIDVKNPVTFSPNAPFFLTSSRIFRTCNYSDKHILPIDYLVYYYHLEKGPIYYYDKIMAVYMTSSLSTFASLDTKLIRSLNSMFPYKLFLLFGRQKDFFCTEMLLKYGQSTGIGDKYYKRLLFLKKILGINLAWKAFMYLNFVPKFGRDCLNINYIYANRKKVKDVADKRTSQEDLNRLLLRLNVLYQNKNVSHSDLQIKKLFNAVALKAIEFDNFEFISMCEQKYPEFQKYIFSSYRKFEVDYPIKLKKYKKRYQYLIYTSIILLVFSIASLILLWSNLQ